MPLSELQSRVLRLIAAARSPESDVAGAAPLQRDGDRLSDDVDIFHDREEAVARAAEADAAVLAAHGFVLAWLRREPGLHALTVGDDKETTRLEWLRDSDFRFFPTLPDALFGYRLHAIDLATNKALAAAGRSEPRDVLDLLFVHDRILPLGAVLWAAVGKDEGFSPLSLLREIRRNARHRTEDYLGLKLTTPMDGADIARRLRAAIDDAERFADAMPPDQAGLLFLRDSHAVEPDPARLDACVAHGGQRRGHWPTSSEIGGAMLRVAETRTP